MLLVQFRMRSCAVEGNSMSFMIRFVNKNPVSLNMTAIRIFPLSLERVVAAFRGQGLFVHNHAYDFTKFEHLLTLFLQQFKLFSKTSCVNRFKHKLIVRGRIVRIISHKIFPHFVKRAKSFCGNLTAHHCTAFLYGGNRFCIGSTISANRTFMRRRCFRGKIDDYPTRRNLTRNFKSTAIRRYFYGLCHGHTFNVSRKAA